MPAFPLAKPLLALSLLTLTLFAPGCEGLAHIASGLPVGDGATAEAETQVYPDAPPVGEAVEVEVIRVGRKQVRFDNRTPLPMTDVKVWLNEQYAATLDELPIGRSEAIPLAAFINEHGEPFPVGSFLQPEQSRLLVAAAIEADGRMHPLHVRLESDWRRN